MGWFLGVGLVVWLAFFAVIDRPEIEAWKVRNRYRWLSILLVILLGLATSKGLLWRQELRFTLQQLGRCR